MSQRESMSYDVVIVGAGPTGLACGIELKKRGLTALLLDKGCLTNSLYHYPTNMVFFTTPELLEIGGIPMTSLGEKPVRGGALKYYRRVADHYGLDIRQYEEVTGFAAPTATSPSTPRIASGKPARTRQRRSSSPPATTTNRDCWRCPAKTCPK